VTPNQDQVLALVRAILLIAGTFLVTTETHAGLLSATDWATLSGVALTIIPIVWSMFAHAKAEKLRRLAGATTQ